MDPIIALGRCSLYNMPGHMVDVAFPQQVPEVPAKQMDG